MYINTAAITSKHVGMKRAGVSAENWTKNLSNTKQETWKSGLPLDSQVGYNTFLHWTPRPMVPSAHCHPSQSPLEVSALPITKILAKKLFAMTRNTFSKTLVQSLQNDPRLWFFRGVATMSRKRNAEWRR